MESDGLVAERLRKGTPKRRGAVVSGGAKRTDAETTRTQLHLGTTTARRLAVHAAMTGRNSSRIADEILTSWLARYGKGKELFADDSAGQLDPPVE